MRETIITGFRQTGRKCGNPVYSFFGIREDSGTGASCEELVEWETFLKGENGLLIPACVMGAVDEEQMAAEMFWQMEKVCPKDISVKKNEKLFDSFREYRHCGKNRIICDSKGYGKSVELRIGSKGSYKTRSGNTWRINPL